MNVDAILRAKGASVETAQPDWTVLDAARHLVEKRIGALVVSSDGSSIDGIISEHDIIRETARGDPSLLERPVSEVMARDVITCVRSDTVTLLMSVMTDRRIRHLPVIADGALVGIVSIGDVVKRRIEETEYEAESLRRYIATG